MGDIERHNVGLVGLVGKGGRSGRRQQMKGDSRIRPGGDFE